MSTMIRVRPETHAALHELAAAQHTSMQEVLSRAVEAYKREQLIEETNKAYAALRANPEAWQDHQDEVAGLDGTLMDGLDAYSTEPETGPNR